MPTKSLFATLIHTSKLATKDWATLNRQLLRECHQLAQDDVAGQRWSAKNYPGGYTSYNSVCRMHQISPTFARLALQINRHVGRYARELGFDLDGRELVMTDCWVNIMPQQVVHGLHLHPLSTISGTYYVQTPKGCSSIKFEDPRLDRFMAAPPRSPDCKPEQQPWFSIPAEAGKLVLFESWLRHEVPPNPSKLERISISFNYNWF